MTIFLAKVLFYYAVSLTCTQMAFLLIDRRLWTQRPTTRPTATGRACPRQGLALHVLHEGRLAPEVHEGEFEELQHAEGEPQLGSRVHESIRLWEEDS